MADNFLEKHRDEYEKRKALWLEKKNKTKRIYLDIKNKTPNN